MKENILKLIDYLNNNGYVDDAKQIKKLMHEINYSIDAQQRLCILCHPRYLGNRNISEFKNPKDWINFLNDISKSLVK